MATATAADVVKHIRTMAVIRLAFQEGFVSKKHSLIEEYMAFEIQHKTDEVQPALDEQQLVKHLKFLNFLAVSAVSGSDQALAPHAESMLHDVAHSLAAAGDQIRRVFRLRAMAIQAEAELAEKKAKEEAAAAAAKTSTATTPAPQPPGGPVHIEDVSDSKTA